MPLQGKSSDDDDGVISFRSSERLHRCAASDVIISSEPIDHNIHTRLANKKCPVERDSISPQPAEIFL